MSKTLQQKPVLRDVKKDSLPTAKAEEKQKIRLICVKMTEGKSKVNVKI